MALNKPWQEYDPAQARRITGALGVYELGDAAGNVVYIGFAGGKSRFGLRGEIVARLANPSGNAELDGKASKFRYEVNMMYLTRFVELLEKHQDATGAIPAANAMAGEYVPTVVLRRRPRQNAKTGGV